MSELTAMDFPLWTSLLGWFLVCIAVGCAILVTIDVSVRPQKMAVMNVVWPVVMLFGSVLWAWFYWRYARAPRRTASAPDESEVEDESPHPFPLAVAIDTNHCGAGCALGDLLGEALLAAIPGLAALAGFGTLHQQQPVSGWIIGTVLAFLFGIAFQYFAIAPMQDLGFVGGLRRAVKADAASIAAWQVGMIGTMALIQLVWLPHWLHGFAAASTPQFWVFMQVAMVVGYGCSYPVNWWLVRAGVKAAM